MSQVDLMSTRCARLSQNGDCGMEMSDELLAKIGQLDFDFYKPRTIIKGSDALLIWQYLRFNSDYIESFKLFEKQLHKLEQEEDRDQLAEAFAESWGMSEPIHYAEPQTSKSFYFSCTLVRRIGPTISASTLASWWRPQLGAPEPIILWIDPRADRKLIQEQVNRLLPAIEKDKNRNSKPKASAKSHLGDDFVCFYLFKVLGLRPIDVEKRYRQLVGTGLDTTQRKRKIKTFEKVSSLAPWCFFQSPG